MSCQVAVSTVFIFESPQYQNAANTVYLQKKTYDQYQSTINSNNVYTFKSDYERMLYITGRYARGSNT
jgi:hypothetical protein